MAGVLSGLTPQIPGKDPDPDVFRYGPAEIAGTADPTAVQMELTPEQTASMEASAKRATVSSPAFSIGRTYSRLVADFEDEGPEYGHQHLNELFKTDMFTKPAKMKRAQLEYGWHQYEKELDEIIANGPDEYSDQIRNFVAGAGASMLDPVNAALIPLTSAVSAFIGAKYMTTAIKAGMPKTAAVLAQMGDRSVDFGVRATIGANLAEGVAANAVSTGVSFAERRTHELDYSVTEALVNTLAFPLVFSGAHALSSAARGKFKSTAAHVAESGKDMNGRDVMIRIAQDDMRPNDMSAPPSDIFGAYVKDTVGMEAKTIGEAVEAVSVLYHEGKVSEARLKRLNDILFAEGKRPEFQEKFDPQQLVDRSEFSQAEIDRSNAVREEHFKPDEDDALVKQELQESMETMRSLEAQTPDKKLAIFEKTKEKMDAAQSAFDTIKKILKNAIPCKGKRM